MFSGLYVTPTWRRHGIARALLTRVLADYTERGVTGHADPFGDTRGMSHLMLERFYRRHGTTVTRLGQVTWPAYPDEETT
jgi:GNAT superfamily N-acetyltransferase